MSNRKLRGLVGPAGLEPKVNRSRGLFLKGAGLRLAVVGVAIAATLVLLFWNTAPQAYLTVDQVLAEADYYYGRTLEIRGTVGLDSVDEQQGTFVLAEGDDTLTVRYRALPENFSEGKEVVVTGVLRPGTGGQPLYEVTGEILVGCTSDYSD